MTTTLITGASQGIGAHLLKHFAAKGHDLVLTDLDKEGLLSQKDEIIGPHVNVEIKCHKADSTDENEVRNVVKEVYDSFGDIDNLINNAGIVGPKGPFHTNDLDDWKRTIQTNLFGMIHYTHSVLPRMLEVDSGRILNILGGGAGSSRPTLSGYGTSKAAALRFTTSVGDELTDTNVAMNGMGPGVVDTDLIWEIIDSDKVAESYEEKLRRKFDEGNVTEPEHLCRFAEFLVSDEMSVTGGIWEIHEWDNIREDHEFD